MSRIKLTSHRNSTGFDLWEEVNGSSFFTTQNQFRALVQGGSLAKTLGTSCESCNQAPEVACFLDQSYWNGEYYIANINVNNGRSGKDANTMLGSISVFDLHASCDDPSVQPCNSRALSSFKAWVDTFRNSSLYPINAKVPKNSGVAVGRYPEDIYYGGNPWYLITAGAAEYLYDAVAQWKSQRSLTVDKASLGFFKDIYPHASIKTYNCDSRGKKSEFDDILSAVTAYGDSFVRVVEKYTPRNGSLSEQFNKTSPGNPLSAYDLTWSYAAFVSMAERRAGQYPPSWVSSFKSKVPAHCKATSVKGSYYPALAAGAPNVTTSCTSNVLFMVNATTYFGENIYLAGNTTDLGAWDINNAQPMSASNYTSDRPLWFANIPMTAGETVSYGYVRQENCNQPYIYETLNRTLVVPPCDPNAGDKPQLTTNDAWTGPVGSSGGC